MKVIKLDSDQVAALAKHFGMDSSKLAKAGGAIIDIGQSEELIKKLGVDPSMVEETDPELRMGLAKQVASELILKLEDAVVKRRSAESTRKKEYDIIEAWEPDCHDDHGIQFLALHHIGYAAWEEMNVTSQEAMDFAAELRKRRLWLHKVANPRMIKDAGVKANEILAADHKKPISEWKALRCLYALIETLKWPLEHNKQIKIDQKRQWTCGECK